MAIAAPTLALRTSKAQWKRCCGLALGRLFCEKLVPSRRSIQGIKLPMTIWKDQRLAQRITRARKEKIIPANAPQKIAIINNSKAGHGYILKPHTT